MRSICIVISMILLLTLLGKIINVPAEALEGSEQDDVDMEEEFFVEIFPKERTWYCGNEDLVIMKINISWENLSGCSYFYEFARTRFNVLEGNWTPVTLFQNISGAVGLVADVKLYTGDDHWIQFKAVRRNGTSMISRPMNIWVDSNPPSVKSTSIPLGCYLLSPHQNISFHLEDKETGINRSTVQYSYSVDNDKTWSEWKNCPTEGNLTNVIAYVDEYFHRGKVNYIMVRANDFFGNQMSGWRKYQVWINAYPEIVIASPLSSNRYFEDETIIFDASSSYDPDGDRLTISWYRSTPYGLESLGEAGQVSARFPAGEHTITVSVNDSVNNEIQKTFVITVEKVPFQVVELRSDSDYDRMPDWWEERFGLNIYFNDSMYDGDRDGFVNVFEFAGNTDPWDPESYPVFPLVPEESSDEGSDRSRLIFPSFVFIFTVLVIFILAFFTGRLTRRKKTHYEE